MNEMIVFRTKHKHKCAKGLVSIFIIKKGIFPNKTRTSIPGAY